MSMASANKTKSLSFPRAAIAMKNEFDSIPKCIIALADALDGLADLGVTMGRIDNPSVVGREKFIDRQLESIHSTAHTLCSMIDQLELDSRVKQELRTGITTSSDALVRSFQEMSRQTGNPEPHLAREIVESWTALRNMIHDLCKTLRCESEPGCVTIIERRADYQKLIEQVLPIQKQHQKSDQS